MVAFGEPEPEAHALAAFSGGRPRSGEVGQDTSVTGFTSYANPDDLVGRKGLAIYSTMQRDPQVRACLAIKKSSVLARGWEVKASPGSGSGGQEVADFCSWVLDVMPGSIARVLWNVADALAKGYSIQNMVWDVVRSGKWSGKWAPVMLKSKDPEEWDFEVDKFRNIVALLHPSTSDRFPRDRFVVYTYNGEYENPYGTSDLRACYRNWWSKDFLGRFWNLYLEKFGSPTAKGTYRRGAPKAAQDELLAVLARIRAETAIVVPDDVQVDLLETIRQGDVGYRLAVDFHNREIAKSILNMTLITDEGGGGIGSFAMAKVHLDVLRMCLRGLKRDLEESVMREQVLKPMVAFNFGIDAPAPVFSLGPMEDRELAPMSSGIKALVDCGVLDAKDPFIREYLGLQGAIAGPGRPDPAPTVQRARVDGDTNDGKVAVGT